MLSCSVATVRALPYTPFRAHVRFVCSPAAPIVSRSSLSLSKSRSAKPLRLSSLPQLFGYGCFFISLQFELHLCRWSGGQHSHLERPPSSQRYGYSSPTLATPLAQAANWIGIRAWSGNLLVSLVLEGYFEACWDANVGARRCNISATPSNLQ